MMMESGEWQGFSDRELKSLRQSQQPKRVVILPPTNSPRNGRHLTSSLGENCALAGPKLAKPQVKKGRIGTGTGGKRSNSTSSSPAQPEDIPCNAFFKHPERDLKAKAATTDKGSSKVPAAPESLVMVRDSAVSPSDDRNENTVVRAAVVQESAITGTIATADTVDYPELKET